MVQPGTIDVRPGGCGFRRGDARTRRRQRRRHRRGCGVGVTVCGAEIEPVIVRLRVLEAVGDLGDLRVRRFVGGLEIRLQRGDFLAEPGDRLLHRLALFDRGDVGLGRRGRRESAAAPARRRWRRAQRQTSPKRRARHSVCGAAAGQSAARRRRSAPSARSRRAGSIGSCGSMTGGRLGRGLGCCRRRAKSMAIRRSAVRSWPAIGVAALRSLPARFGQYLCVWPWPVLAIGCSPIGNHVRLPIGYQWRAQRVPPRASQPRFSGCFRAASRLDRQAVFGRQRLERHRRPRADMLDHFGGGERAEAGAQVR